MAGRPLVSKTRRSGIPGRAGGHPHSFQADDFGPQVGQHHGAERPRTEAGEFDDTEPGQRSRWVSLGRTLWVRVGHEFVR